MPLCAPSAGYSAVGRQASAADTQDSLGVSGDVSLRPSMRNGRQSTVDRLRVSARAQ
jgi:hypothetical protein